MSDTGVTAPYAELHGRVERLIEWATEMGYRSTMRRVGGLLDGLPSPRDAEAAGERAAALVASRDALDDLQGRVLECAERLGLETVGRDSDRLLGDMAALAALAGAGDAR